MQKLFRRGYSNLVTLYASITDVFRTANDITFGLAVRDESDYTNYPRVIFFQSKLKKIDVDELEKKFPAGSYVKIKAHIQTVPEYQKSNKRIPYQSLVGDSIESVLPEYAPDNKNEVIINGYTENIRVTRQSNGLVRLTLHTKRANHDSYIHGLIFTDDPEQITDKIRAKDFIYTIGKVQTRRTAINGRWSVFEDIVIHEIYRENNETHKLRMLYGKENTTKIPMDKKTDVQLDFESSFVQNSESRKENA